MRILSEDGSFGISLTPADFKMFFVFKVKVGEEWWGDGEASIEWTSVKALSSPLSIDDSRVDPETNSADAILDLLTSETEPELYDRTLVQFGESMDRYIYRSYCWGDEAVFLFREVGEDAGAVMGRVSRSELLAMAAATQAAHAAFDASR